MIFGISIGILIINIIFECINIEWFKYINFICNILLLIGIIFIGLFFSINSLLFIFMLCFFLYVFFVRRNVGEKAK